MHLTSSDPHAQLPADYTFTASDNGVHQFQVTLQTTGSQSIAVTDKANPGITGIAGGLQVYSSDDDDDNDDQHGHHGHDH